MRTDDLDFHLPPELIAQVPAADRSASRLLHYRRSDRSITHRRFVDLPSLLRAGDLLVFNDAQVIPARFVLRKTTGGRVEGLFLGQRDTRIWDVLLKNVGTGATSMHFDLSPQITARIAERGEEGQFRIAVDTDEPAIDLLSRIGRMPLPPYIKRDKDHDPRDDDDRHRYQTIYARNFGSVAAPTAGLHFTEPILSDLSKSGIEKTNITLHVGLGTFKPVTSNTLEGHRMHSESYSISADAADILNRAKRDRRRIIAVGTTSARVLESQPLDGFTPKTDQTTIFIHPPYQWKHIHALITNFHLPRSTLVALVAALVGLDEQRRIYAQAIGEAYRFFSYGDATLLE